MQTTNTKPTRARGRAAPVPQCERHGTMEQSEPGTPEQKFCGVWYRCTACARTLLLESEALATQLAQQRAARRAEKRS